MVQALHDSILGCGNCGKEYPLDGAAIALPLITPHADDPPAFCALDPISVSCSTDTRQPGGVRRQSSGVEAAYATYLHCLPAGAGRDAMAMFAPMTSQSRGSSDVSNYATPRDSLNGSETRLFNATSPHGTGNGTALTALMRDSSYNDFDPKLPEAVGGELTFLQHTTWLEPGVPATVVEMESGDDSTATSSQVSCADLAARGRESEPSFRGFDASGIQAVLVGIDERLSHRGGNTEGASIRTPSGEAVRRSLEKDAAETARKSAETARKSSEAVRKSADAARKSAEAARKSAEIAHKASLDRKSTESVDSAAATNTPRSSNSTIASTSTTRQRSFQMSPAQLLGVQTLGVQPLGSGALVHASNGTAAVGSPRSLETLRTSQTSYLAELKKLRSCKGRTAWVADSLPADAPAQAHASTALQVADSLPAHAPAWAHARTALQVAKSLSADAPAHAHARTAIQVGDPKTALPAHSSDDGTDPSDLAAVRRLGRSLVGEDGSGSRVQEFVTELMKRIGTQWACINVLKLDNVRPYTLSHALVSVILASTVCAEWPPATNHATTVLVALGGAVLTTYVRALKIMERQGLPGSSRQLVLFYASCNQTKVASIQ